MKNTTELTDAQSDAIATVYEATAAVYRASPDNRPEAIKALKVATEALDVLLFAIIGNPSLSFRESNRGVEELLHDARTASTRARMIFERAS
jgi:hypothetical protein